MNRKYVYILFFLFFVVSTGIFLYNIETIESVVDDFVGCHQCGTISYTPTVKLNDDKSFNSNVTSEMYRSMGNTKMSNTFNVIGF